MEAAAKTQDEPTQAVPEMKDRGSSETTLPVKGPSPGDASTPVSTPLLSTPKSPERTEYHSAKGDSSPMDEDYPIDVKALDQEVAKVVRQRKYVCCCYRTRKSCCLYSCAILTLFIIGLGLTVFFLWPRIPTAQVEPFEVPEGAQALNYNQTTDPKVALANASPEQPFGAWITFIAPITMTSANFIDLRLNFVDLLVTFQGPQEPLSAVVITGRVRNEVIKGRDSSRIPIVSLLPCLYVFSLF